MEGCIVAAVPPRKATLFIKQPSTLLSGMKCWQCKDLGHGYPWLLGTACYSADLYRCSMNTCHEPSFPLLSVPMEFPLLMQNSWIRRRRRRLCWLQEFDDSWVRSPQRGSILSCGILLWVLLEHLKCCCCGFFACLMDFPCLILLSTRASNVTKDVILTWS